MDILHRAIYRFNVIPSKLSLDIFHRTRTNNPLKMLWNYTKDTELPRNPEEKEQSRRHNPHKFQTQSCSYQMVCYWHKNRHAGQWNRIQNSDVNPHAYGKLTFNKGDKNAQRRKESLFSKQCWKIWKTSCKSMKLEYIITPNKK